MKRRGKPDGGNGHGIRRMLRAEGEVQGVGFRWTARRLAGECGVRGMAENAYDGSVRLVVEGAAEAINRFVMLLGMQYPAAEIAVTGRDAPAAGLEGFEIR